MHSIQKAETNATFMRFLKKKAAKFAADAPQVRAYDLLRAAISGDHTQNVPCQEDVVKRKQQKSDFTSSDSFRLIIRLIIGLNMVAYVLYGR